MGRLKKLAEDLNQVEEVTNVQTENQNFDVVIDLLTRINANAEQLKDVYYSLLENLNALNKDYAGVYNELKVLCKLPNKNTINDIATFKDDIEKATLMLSDKNFLSGIVK